MLVQQIVPLIQAAISRGVVKAIGAEDSAELAAEGVALAARWLDSAEQRGKIVAPNSLAYYAIQALKSGRRTSYAGRTDAMSAAVQLDGNAAVTSMDEELDKDDEADCLITLHDILAGQSETADITAARDLDWPMVADRLDSREQYVVRETAIETSGIAMAQHLKISTPRVVQIKREVADKIRDAWGEDALADAVREPMWHARVRAHAECRACRAERRVA